MKTQMTIPYFTIDAPYEQAYRNNGTSSPARPHTHNALEIYLTMSDLPDVLLDDTVSSVSKGSLIIIPPHHVHQLFNQKLTIYERYVLNINSDLLYTVLGAGSGLMPFAVPAFSPAILRLSPSGLTGLCSQLDHYLQLHPQPSLSAYADFFSLLTVQNVRLCHICIAGLNQYILHAVLNALHIDLVVFDLFLEISSHSQIQQIYHVFVILHLCRIKCFLNSAPDFLKVKVCDFAVPFYYLKHIYYLLLPHDYRLSHPPPGRCCQELILADYRLRVNAKNTISWIVF